MQLQIADTVSVESKQLLIQIDFKSFKNPEFKMISKINGFKIKAFKI